MSRRKRNGIHPVMTIVAIAAVLGEALRPLEEAKPGKWVDALLAFQLWLERRMVLQPNAQMVEVAVYAYNAARENDR